MEIFLVGGAVRDELLGKPIKERDWVVVGSTPDEMISKGYQPVGKDFPVFLHPKTHEEYALARTERKTGKGYKGFHFYATPEVSLNEDLIRRDLTINAMAKNTHTGEIIDPYHGQRDLQQKIFRHVSNAFSEDPVRILRIARFACVLTDFHVHPETNALMQHMVNIGELDALVPERIWKEFSRALISENPQRFFEVLSECHAMTTLFPEINHRTDFSAFKKAIVNTPSGLIRFASLCYSLSLNELQSLCKRFRVPTEFSELATLTVKYHADYRDCDRNNAEQLFNILKSIDAFRRPERFLDWIAVCETIYEKKNHRTVLLSALDAAKSVSVQNLLNENLQGKAFADRLTLLQKQAIAAKNI